MAPSYQKLYLQLKCFWVLGVSTFLYSQLCNFWQLHFPHPPSDSLNAPNTRWGKLSRLSMQCSLVNWWPIQIGLNSKQTVAWHCKRPPHDVTSRIYHILQFIVELGNIPVYSGCAKKHLAKNNKKILQTKMKLFAIKLLKDIFLSYALSLLYMFMFNTLLKGATLTNPTEHRISMWSGVNDFINFKTVIK